jgi:hypothetical protein
MVGMQFGAFGINNITPYFRNLKYEWQYTLQTQNFGKGNIPIKVTTGLA